jgi:predicted membrane chloride channel (bestrophin family)
MIDYLKGIYGTNLLRRVHGSALYRGSLVGLLSVFVYLLIVLRWNVRGRHDQFLPDGAHHDHDGRYGGNDYDDAGGDLNDPLAVGVLISSVTFLIVFRANTGYQRYWEACGYLHHFLSKSSDAAMQTANFHLQCRHYDAVRPMDFYGNHKTLDDMRITLDRTRRKKEDGVVEKDEGGDDGGGSCGDDDVDDDDDDDHHHAIPTPAAIDRAELYSRSFPPPSSRTIATATATAAGGDDDGIAIATTPPLFLQELAHLSSLACAVALSTLRNDESVSRYESPLDAYVPGMDMPNVDPDAMSRHLRNDFQPPHHLLTLVMYWLGLDRLPEWRSRYNAARPLHVLGGVSDSEVIMLRRARGSHAKAELANNWLKEFIIRESLCGSLGDVHTSIVSRIVQNMSDAMVGYYQARKVTYIPFPFPHAQLCAFFTFVMVFGVPFMMDQYADMPWTGMYLTFLTVTCLVGLHEVARELENPFRNVPNEIPLCALMASYNETLLTMFGGYNPDAVSWDPETLLATRRRRRHGGDRERCCGEGIRNTTTFATTSAEGLPTTTVTESMTTTSSKVIDCQPEAEADSDDNEKTNTTEECVEFFDGEYYNVEKALLENMLAKQAMEVEELCRLLDEMEEKDESGDDEVDEFDDE